MQRKTWVRIGTILFVLAAGLAAYQLVAAFTHPLPVYMKLPEVSLTDQNGQPFDLSQIRGKIVLLNPIYTHCPDVCPLTTSNMKQLQDRVRSAGLDGQIQLVTFTVDPDRDNTDVLKRYAAVYHVDLTNWVFLTGPTAQVKTMIQTLGLYVERLYYVDNTPIPETSLPAPPTGAPYLVSHTDRVFLVDRQGNVRSLLPGSRMDIDQVMQLIQQLLKEKDGGRLGS